jgi:hypothetical protein
MDQSYLRVGGKGQITVKTWTRELDGVGNDVRVDSSSVRVRHSRPNLPDHQVHNG